MARQGPARAEGGAPPGIEPGAYVRHGPCLLTLGCRGLRRGHVNERQGKPSAGESRTPRLGPRTRRTKLSALCSPWIAATHGAGARRHVVPE